MSNFNLSNFIKEGKIQWQGIKMENTENIMVNLNFGGKHHFVLLLAFCNLDGPSIFPKFNFYQMFNFLVFQPISFKEERESNWILIDGRENHRLTLILATRKVNVDINRFHSMRTIWWWLFLSLNIHGKGDWVQFIFFSSWFGFFEWFQVF